MAAPLRAAPGPRLDALTDEVLAGDLVHVAGHGPATVLAANAAKCEVRYPNGDLGQVDRGHILVRQELRAPSPPGASSPTGPRRLEYLGRAFDDPSRNIDTRSAAFSLVATMVGGGVLSLPYAMSQCGLVLGIVVLFASAALSAWTVGMLVECARCTGRDTFELVGHAAFGERCRLLTVLLVFLLTWLAQVAYFVLMQDLFAPLAELVVPSLLTAWSEDTVRRTVVVAAALLIAPLCTKSSLSSLRSLCVASVASVLLVGIILGIKAVTGGHDHTIVVINPDKSSRILDIAISVSLLPASFSKALYVFPMFGISFLCHFNALPTHQELLRPTRQRVKRVLVLCLGLTTVLYIFVGVSGYVWAGRSTCGNILLNFARNDGLVAVGRGALGLVLMLNLPLLLQPSRNALFRLLVAGGLRPAAPSVVEAEAPSAALVMTMDEASTSAGAASSTVTPPEAVVAVTAAPAGGCRGRPEASGPSGTARHRSPSPARAAVGGAQVFAYRREDTRGAAGRQGAAEAVDSFLPKDETVQQSAMEPTARQRYCLTALILVSATLLSVFMKSILVVWSVLGSTVAFMIGFILPSAFWYRLVGPQASPHRRRAAVVLLVAACVLAVTCSTLTAMNLDTPACPVVHQDAADIAMNLTSELLW